MAATGKIRVVYVTSSTYKKEENENFVKNCSLADGRSVSDVFDFDIRPVPIQEILNVDLSKMVSAEVVSAYGKLKVPCIVEHAGLIFDDYAGNSYPGGLTKPMWDTLGDRFIAETRSANRKASARAVVAYCDGKTVRTFEGDRKGTIADAPRGARKFYWDTVFIPDDPTGKAVKLTYAEIVENTTLGLTHKIKELSQSAIAMKQFLAYRLSVGEPELWK